MLCKWRMELSWCSRPRFVWLYIQAGLASLSQGEVWWSSLRWRFSWLPCCYDHNWVNTAPSWWSVVVSNLCRWWIVHKKYRCSRMRDSQNHCFSSVILFRITASVALNAQQKVVCFLVFLFDYLWEGTLKCFNVCCSTLDSAYGRHSDLSRPHRAGHLRWYVWVDVICRVACYVS